MDPTCSGRPGFNPWVGKISWRRKGKLVINHKGLLIHSITYFSDLSYLLHASLDKGAAVLLEDVNNQQ